MNITYCLPIIKKSKQEVLDIIRKSADYQYVEVWVDYIEDLDKTFIEELLKLLKERFIAVFRRHNLEQTRMDLKKRLTLISVLDNSGSLLDLDIYSQKEELNYIKNNSLRIQRIVSYHNYQETPQGGQLKEILATMEEYKPEIYKIATLCNGKHDALRLLELLLQIRGKGHKCIVSGMGEHGVITRIFGTLWGNEMVFAPKIIAEQSAEGQLAKSQCEIIFDQLKGN